MLSGVFMKNKKLREAIAPCCGLGANRDDIDSALNEVEALIAHRDLLLIEVLNVLENSLDAMKGHRFQEDEIINHLSAMKAIRSMFSSTSSSVEKFNDGLLSAFGDGWYEGFLKAKKLSNKGLDLTEYDPLGMSEHEEDFGKFGVLGERLLEQANSLRVLTAEVGRKPEEHLGHLVALIRPVRVRDTLSKSGRWVYHYRCFPHQSCPWNQSASIKSIERRIQAAIQCRDFSKAQRLDNVKQALQSIKTGGAV